MSGVIIGGLIGLLLGGARGLVIGALIGLAARWALISVLKRGLQQGQLQFLDTTFAVMGALSKADGVVTRDEIQSAQSVFDMLRLSSQQPQPPTNPSASPGPGRWGGSRLRRQTGRGGQRGESGTSVGIFSLGREILSQARC